MIGERHKKLRKRVESLEQAKAKAEGAVEELKNQLFNEFKCKSVAAAKKLLAQIEEEHAIAEKQFERDLKQFEHDYGRLLG